MYIINKILKVTALSILLIFTTSCSKDSWWGLSEKKEILKGERKLMFGGSKVTAKQNHDINLHSINNLKFDRTVELKFDEEISIDNQLFVNDHIIYFINKRNNIGAFDTNNKKKLWEHSIGNKKGSELSKLTFSNDLIFAINEEGLLKAYKKSGEQVWQTKLEYPANQLEVNNKYNVLCVTHVNFNINCVDLKGNKIVVFDDHTTDITVTSKFVPKIDDNILYYANKNGTVRAFDLFKGAEIWRTNSSDKFELSFASFYNLIAKPVLDTHNIYIANYIGGISALDKFDGREIWFKPIKPVDRMRKYSDYLVGTTTDNKFSIIKVDNGEVIYYKELFNDTNNDKNLKIIDFIAQGNNEVIFIMQSGLVYRLDLKTEKVDQIFDFHTVVLGTQEEVNNLVIIAKNKIYKVPTI